MDFTDQIMFSYLNKCLLDNALEESYQIYNLL